MVEIDLSIVLREPRANVKSLVGPDLTVLCLVKEFLHVLDLLKIFNKIPCEQCKQLSGQGKTNYGYMPILNLFVLFCFSLDLGTRFTEFWPRDQIICITV